MIPTESLLTSGLHCGGAWSNDVGEVVLAPPEVEGAGEEDHHDTEGGDAERGPVDRPAEAGCPEGSDEAGQGVAGHESLHHPALAHVGLHVHGGGGEHPNLNE